MLVEFSLVAHGQSREDFLLRAIANGDFDAVRGLLEAGANPNAVNEHGHPALLVAAVTGSSEIVTLLIDKGAAIDGASKDKGFTPLIAAAAKGNTEMVRILIAKRAAADARDNTGGTALMAAALEGHADVVAMLLENGGNVDATSRRGLTALMLAASRCRIGATKTLWNAGANFEAKDDTGTTASNYAASAKCPALLRIVAAQPCKDMSSLYARNELARLEPIFRQQVLDAKAEIERQVKSENRDLLSHAKILTPLSLETCGDPLYFVSFSAAQEIRLPVLSLKFLHDLLYAKWWLNQNGYQDKTIRYVNMLKYRRAADFPGRKYPSPFDALGIPNDAGNPRYDSQAARDLFRLIWDGALFYVTAHEAGHIVGKHLRSTPANENGADGFAVELLSRFGKYPGGVADFFRFASYWVPSPADFEDPFQYLVWLRAESSHPASTSRMKILATSLRENPERYLRGLSASDPKLASVRAMGLELTDDADAIDRDVMVADLFGAALRANLSTLAPEKVTPTSEEDRIWRKYLGP